MSWWKLLEIFYGALEEMGGVEGGVEGGRTFETEGGSVRWRCEEGEDGFGV